MGNAEMRRMTAPTPVLGPEVQRLRDLHATFRGDFIVDRTMFSNLFDSSVVSYAFVDECFSAFDTNNDGTVQLSEIIFAVCFGMRPANPCDTVSHLKDRLGFLFQVFDQNGDKLLTRAELLPWIEKVATESFARQRQFVSAHNPTPHRCLTCAQTLSPASAYLCVACTTQHVLGMPQMSLFCISCMAPHRAGTSHRLLLRGTSHEKDATWQTHVGYECSACTMSPVVGNMFLCDDCATCVVLCQKCFDNNVEPGTHRARHSVTRRERRVPLATLVADFVAAVFASGDLNGDGYLTQNEFAEWGLGNETVLRLMACAVVHDVRLCEYAETVLEDRRDLMWAQSVGIVPASEV